MDVLVHCYFRRSPETLRHQDVNHVRAVLIWSLKPGFLKLFAWSPDFNSNNHKQQQRNAGFVFWNCLKNIEVLIFSLQLLVVSERLCVWMMQQKDDLGEEPTNCVTNNVTETCVDNNPHLESAKVLKTTVDGEVVSTIDIMHQEDMSAQIMRN
ncbi:hypothetical protein MTR_7g023300 [Medicago truncatula]|uniref:Uncharacterized protein n=1 Tax=Medicago truncatula TaxID=3880 RepID=A0A072U7U6_MEDTR|nr:hypothetical protein MTR_7g023300 [Medicago truncatula]